MALWDIVNAAGYALDTPGALLRGLLAGKPGKRVSGRELLGLTENKPGLDSGDVAGFAAEMVVDPLNLLGGAAIGKLAKTLSGVNKARKAGKAAKAATAAKTAMAAKPAAAAGSVVRAADSAEPVFRTLAARNIYDELTDILRDVPHRGLERDLNVGGRWTAKHYLKKADPVTGQVTNPNSKIPLWVSSHTGRDTARRMASGNSPWDDMIPTKAGDYNAAVTGPRGNILEYNPSNLKQLKGGKGQVGATGAHEGAHTLVNLDENMHDSLKYFLNQATRDARQKELLGMMDGTLKMNAEQAKHLKYLRQPGEMFARVAMLRRAMEKTGIGVDEITDVASYAPGSKLFPILQKQGAVRAFKQLYKATGSGSVIRDLLEKVPVIAAAAAVPAAYGAMNQEVV